MKYLLILATVVVIVCSNSWAQIQVTIHLVTVDDSVDFLPTKLYCTTYKLVNPQDSIYVKTEVSFNADMGHTSASPYYTFNNSIPDGVYKVVIDNKAIEKTTIFNNKKNGFWCSYDEVDFFTIRAYKNDSLIEYNKIDTNGNVVAHSPCLSRFAVPLATDFIYRFSSNNQFVGITYAFSLGSLILTEHFDDNSLQKTTYYPKDYGIKRLGIEAGDTLNGIMKVSWFDEVYSLHFESGQLLKWHHASAKFDIDRSYNIPSSSIRLKRPDLLSFCTE